MLTAVAILIATTAARSPAAPPAGAQGWRQDQLLIGGWGITHFGDRAMYRRLADAGIDLVVAADSFHVAPIDSALLAARTVQGLREADPAFRLRLLSHVLNLNSAPGDLQVNADPARNAAALRATLDTLGHYPSVAGYWLWDEPADSVAMERAFALARFVAAASPGRLPYVNLFPSYVGDPRQLGAIADRWRATYGANKRQAFPRYLDDWLRRWQDEPSPAPLLSFDHYAYEPSVFVWDDYLLSLRVARDKAAEWSRPGQRIPLWVFVQLAGNRQLEMVPQTAQVRLQVYSALAHGALGIMYWTLCPSHAGPGYAPALLDDRGEPTDRYDAIARLNSEVHALGPTLMGLDPVAVGYTALGGQIGIEDDLFMSPKHSNDLVMGEARSDSACMVAHFKNRKDGADYLLVVNRDLSHPRSFSVRLRAQADSVLLVRRTDGALVPMGAALAAIEVRDLAPGTGELYRVVSGTSVHRQRPPR
jgi:hypothetical protein